MRLSRFLLPVLKETPAEAQIVSHRLMLRAGMIRQEAAGIYAWLPLGFRVLKKIEQIVREEMDRAGAVEMLMPTLQLADLWRESGRYDAYGPEMLRIEDRHKRELLYGPTNEEMITEIFRAYVKSYKALPLNLYHIQWKFRDEQRPRFGVMRGREFLMKDAYSFDLTEEEARKSYNRMFVAYLRTFARMGLKAIPMRAETGPIGGDLSHEFIVLAETGESVVYCDKAVLDLPIPDETVDYQGDLTPIIDQWTSVYAATEDVHDAARYEREVAAADRTETRGIEVGQVFYFGDKYSIPMKATVTGPDGRETPIHGGSYGVGVSRLLGAIIEASHDEAGVIWPEAVAPFGVGIINLRQGDADCDAACETAYAALEKAGQRAALRRHRRAGRGQVRHHGPDRPALAADRRPQGNQGRRGGAETPRYRRARDLAAGRRAGQTRRGRVTDAVAAPFSRWERTLAVRYLRAKRKEGGVALIALLSFAGITVAVAALIIVMSVMNGFSTILLSKMLGFNGHVYVMGPAINGPERDGVISRIRAIPGVKEAAPLVEAQGVAIGPNQLSFTLVRGETPADVKAQKIISDNIKSGSLQGFGQGENGGELVLVGQKLANTLGVKAGDPVTLMSPSGGVTPFGTEPLRKDYIVGGIFSVGVSEYDSAFIYMPLQQAQLFFGRDSAIDRVEVKLDDPDKLDQLKAADRPGRRPAGPGDRLARHQPRHLQRGAGGALHNAADPDDRGGDRGAEHHLRPGDAGEEQDARHRHPAHHGRDAGGGVAGVLHVRRLHRRGGDGDGVRDRFAVLHLHRADPGGGGARHRRQRVQFRRLSALPHPGADRLDRGRLHRLLLAAGQFPDDPAARVAGRAPRSGGGAAL